MARLVPDKKEEYPARDAPSGFNQDLIMETIEEINQAIDSLIERIRKAKEDADSLLAQVKKNMKDRENLVKRGK